MILSDGLWRREFHGDPAMVGRTITLDSQPFTVIGVMPAGLQHVGGDYRSLQHGESVDAWWPFAFWPDRGFRGSHFLNGIARLKPGVTNDVCGSGRIRPGGRGRGVPVAGVAGRGGRSDEGAPLRVSAQFPYDYARLCLGKSYGNALR